MCGGDINKVPPLSLSLSHSFCRPHVSKEAKSPVCGATLNKLLQQQGTFGPGLNLALEKLFIIAIRFGLIFSVLC